MLEPTSTAVDDGRISAAAALVALGGHAVAFLVAVLVAARMPETAISQGVVSVTLIGTEPGAEGAAYGMRQRSAASGRATIPEAPRARPAISGEALDALFPPRSASEETQPPLPAGRVPSIEGPTGRGNGSSRAHQGLGAGEGAEGVDLYAAAALPEVGVRPAVPAGSDLWTRVAPCWRAAAPHTATLLVDLRTDGALSAPPLAVRKAGKPADAQTLLAERAAVRALQACAPYEGLGGRRWRVRFP